jgi:hypothetical protein
LSNGLNGKRRKIDQLFLINKMKEKSINQQVLLLKGEIKKSNLIKQQERNQSIYKSECKKLKKQSNKKREINIKS